MADGLEIDCDMTRKDGRDMDEILESIGPFTPLQIILHISMFYIQIAINCHTLLSFFAGHSPGWKCRNSSTSVFCKHNMNTTIAPGDNDFNIRCHINRSDWTYTTPSTYSFVTEFDLVCSKISVAGMINACFFVGCLCGAIVTGPIGDRLGRKMVICVSSLLLPFPSVLSGYVTEVWQLCVANVVRGVASTGCMYTPYVYLSEVSPPSYRSLSISISNLMCCMSFLLLDGMAYSDQNWRHLFVYSGVLVIPLWCSLYFLPESPRWLLVKGYEERAVNVIEKIKDIRLRGRNHENIRIRKTFSRNSSWYTYWDLLRNCHILKTVVRILIIWAFLPSLYYSISVQAMDLGGNMYEDYALSTLMDIPAFFFASFLNNHAGRKKTNMCASAASGLLIGSVALVPREFTHKHSISLALTSLARMAASVSFYAMYLWTSELFPTVVRGQGLSLSATIEKLGMVSIPFVTNVLRGVNYHLPFVFMCLSGGLVAATGLTLPETNKMPTREKFEELFVQIDRPPNNKVGPSVQ